MAGSTAADDAGVRIGCGGVLVEPITALTKPALEKPVDVPKTDTPPVVEADDIAFVPPDSGSKCRTRNGISEGNKGLQAWKCARPPHPDRPEPGTATRNWWTQPNRW